MSHLNGTFAGIGVKPKVSSALSQTSTTVIVTYNEAMNEDANLFLATNYVITHDVGSVDRVVTLVEIVSPNIVRLTLDGDMTEGVDNYTVTVDLSINDLAGNIVDSAFRAADFNGIGVLVITDCYESSLGILITNIETHLTSTWPEDSSIPYIVSFRNSILTLSNSNPSNRARAHSVIDFAFMTEVGTILKGLNDEIDHRDTTNLCTQSSVFAIDRALTAVYGYIPLAVAELSVLDVPKEVQKLLIDYSKSPSVPHRVSCVSTLVVLAAIKTL